jgi:RNA polymerase sigma-70 factor (ECF subfamily)
MFLARSTPRRDASSEATTQALLLEITPRVTAVVRAVLGAGHADLDDVVQLSLILFVEALPSFRGECAPSAFAARIAARTALRARRRARVRQDHTTALEHEASFVSPATAPDEEASSHHRMELTRGLLDRLPEEQAECLTQRIVLGWSLDEIAQASGAPVNTVRSRIRLGKTALRRAIEADPVLVASLSL